MARTAPVPLYYQVFQVLRDRIVSGDYAARSQLPTDEALMREFQVSRHTVRAAMQQLVSQGLIERFAGRGTFVIERSHRSAQWTIESLEDLIETTFLDKFKVMSARFVNGRAALGVAALFGLGPDDSLFHVRAVRSSAEGPYSYSNTYFPREIGEKLPQHLFTERPLLLLVEEYAGIPAAQVRQVASAGAADRETARLLKLGFGDPILVMERTYFDPDGRPVEHTRIQYRPDRYRQTVSLSRRQALPYLPLGSVLRHGPAAKSSRDTSNG